MTKKPVRPARCSRAVIDHTSGVYFGGHKAGKLWLGASRPGTIAKTCRTSSAGIQIGNLGSGNLGAPQSKSKVRICSIAA
jgi:hypothetical protein